MDSTLEPKFDQYKQSGTNGVDGFNDNKENEAILANVNNVRQLDTAGFKSAVSEKAAYQQSAVESVAQPTAEGVEQNVVGMGIFSGSQPFQQGQVALVMKMSQQVVDSSLHAS